jgi:hypothetical protein
MEHDIKTLMAAARVLMNADKAKLLAMRDELDRAVFADEDIADQVFAMVQRELALEA